MTQKLSRGAMQAGMAVDIARQLESALEALGAAGKGLHEKVSSVEPRLPEALVTKLRFIASVRNKIVHEDELLSEGDLATFVESGRQAVDAIGSLDNSSPPKRSPQVKARKRAKPRQAQTAQASTWGQTVVTLRLSGALLLAGITLVFLLMLLGNDGPALWTGAFSIFFILGWHLLHKLRTGSANAAKG